jgi:uncharacterized membrane protein (Fun14 family)
MTQLLLFFALQLLGSWACLAAGPRDVGLCAALGFVVGLAVAVFLSLPLLLVGQFTVVVVVSVLAVAMLGSVALAVRRQRASLDAGLRLLAWAVGFTALCIPFCIWDLSRLTYDSGVFLEYAEAFQADHRLSLETLGYLHSWGSFQVVGHALALLTGEKFLYALAPAFSISFLATLAVALHRGLGELGVPGRARVLAVALVVAAILAIPLVRVHVVYVHANWAAAGYLFVFAALFWLADLKNDASYLPAAFLSLLAFCFSRVESPMFAAPFLVLALSQTRLARSAILVPYLGFTLVLASWLLLMTLVIPSDSEYLSPSRSLVMVAAICGIFVLFLVRDHAFMKQLLPHVPRLVVGLSVAAIGVIAVARFDVFSYMFPTWQRDLWLGSFWGFFVWPLFAILALLSLRVAAPPFSRPLRYGIAMFLALIVLLTALGDEYGSGRFGSLTRVTLQIVPLIWFYFALVFTPACCRWRQTRGRAN